MEDLDNKLGGFWPSELVVLAGRPGPGKTALALSILKNVGKGPDDEAKAAVFFSLEAPAEQTGERMLAMDSGIAAQQIRTGRLTMDEMLTLVECQGRQEQWPLFIDDVPKSSVAQMRSRVLRLKRQHNIALV